MWRGKKSRSRGKGINLKVVMCCANRCVGFIHRWVAGEEKVETGLQWSFTSPQQLHQEGRCVVGEAGREREQVCSGYPFPKVVVCKEGRVMCCGLGEEWAEAPKKL